MVYPFRAFIPKPRGVFSAHLQRKFSNGDPSGLLDFLSYLIGAREQNPVDMLMRGDSSTVPIPCTR